jgi:formylglycine-generating enzyme required for sulfatase activity
MAVGLPERRMLRVSQTSILALEKMNMRAVMQKIVPWLLCVSGCSPEQAVLLIHVKNLMPEVTGLQVNAQLDGRPQQASYTERLDTLAITISKDAIGQGQLSVILTGISSWQCKVATGKYEAKVSLDQSYTEVDVPLAMISPARCVLTVEKIGDGSVASSPVGVSCGASCTMEVAVGTKVTLTATNGAAFTGSFWTGCSAWNDTCEVTMTQSQKVGVQFGPEVRPKLIKIPKGSFTMGSPTGESGREPDETQHMVTLTTDFWMAESEVTQRQYRNLMGSSQPYFTGADLPIEQVSWFEAVSYCNALSAKESIPPCYQVSGTTVRWADGVKCTGYRLPTEAEWEYAARSPTTNVYAGSNSPDSVAWYSSNSGNTTHAVKTKTANGRGLYDLSGNVWKWVWDIYQPSYEVLPPIDPMGSTTGANRVVRGGSLYDAANHVRVARRGNLVPTSRDNNVGFRVVRSAP